MKHCQEEKLPCEACLEAQVVEDRESSQEEHHLHRDANAVDHVGLQALEDTPGDPCIREVVSNSNASDQVSEWQ